MSRMIPRVLYANTPKVVQPSVRRPAQEPTVLPTRRPNPFFVETRTIKDSTQICNEFLAKNEALKIENNTLKMEIEQLRKDVKHDRQMTKSQQYQVQATQFALQESNQFTFPREPIGIEQYKLSLIHENGVLNTENRRLKEEKERLGELWSYRMRNRTIVAHKSAYV